MHLPGAILCASIYIKEEAIFCVTKGFLTTRRTQSKLCVYNQDNLVVVIMSHFKPNKLVLMIKTRKKAKKELKKKCLSYVTSLKHVIRNKRAYVRTYAKRLCTQQCKLYVCVYVSNVNIHQQSV